MLNGGIKDYVGKDGGRHKMGVHHLLEALEGRLKGGYMEGKKK